LDAGRTNEDCDENGGSWRVWFFRDATASNRCDQNLFLRANGDNGGFRDQDSGFVRSGRTQVDDDVVKTDLGTQTIEGISAQGTRITRTIPAGQIGNVQPIVITTENWYSPGLKVLVMSKSNDPRMGETIYKLTNIQRSEPPPSLFQAPDGYTVKDQSPHVFVNRESKKN
jgi:hypothetical protein